ncbi:hypothetical protein B0H14DRAFT_2605530 [Mycena olivaceomarginata]|nr:hypothetical protein B0H14DRAFT_2605530 [Mycena olivaceomarginata]
MLALLPFEYAPAISGAQVPVLFQPSVEEVDEEDEPRSAPPLHLSSNILQDSADPDLPPTSAYAAWASSHPPYHRIHGRGSILLPPPQYVSSQNYTLPSAACTTPPSNTHPRPPFFRHGVVSPAIMTFNADGDHHGPVTAVANPHHASPETAVSDPLCADIALPSDPWVAPPSHVIGLAFAGGVQPASATSLGKRPRHEDSNRNYAVEPQSRLDTHFSGGVQNVQGYSVEGVLGSHTSTQFNGQFSYNPHVNSSTFNAAHILRPPCNVHQSHGGGADPALTYMSGYWVFVTPESVEPMQIKLQDSPAAEPGEVTKFMTVYTLNKQYIFSRTQTVRAAVPINSVALKYADIPKLIQLYRYFTVPTLSDLVARHRLQTSIRISSLASIIAGRAGGGGEDDGNCLRVDWN